MNAALYDIREYFQGRDGKGRMNGTSSDAKYAQLMARLRAALDALAGEIESKVYEYGFFKR